MTERKWTEGPWRAVRNNAFWEINPKGDRDGRPFIIGDVCASNPDNPDDGLQEANANLIAAAPDMADYIQAKADAGDAEAQRIMAKARGEQE